MILARVVLPTPEGPVKRKLLISPTDRDNMIFNDSTTCSFPINSSKFCGLYFVCKGKALYTKYRPQNFDKKPCLTRYIKKPAGKLSPKPLCAISVFTVGLRCKRAIV